MNNNKIYKINTLYYNQILKYKIISILVKIFKSKSFSMIRILIYYNHKNS